MSLLTSNQEHQKSGPSATSKEWARPPKLQHDSAVGLPSPRPSSTAPGVLRRLRKHIGPDPLPAGSPHDWTMKEMASSISASPRKES